MMWRSSQALHPKVYFWSSNEQPHLEGISKNWALFQSLHSQTSSLALSPSPFLRWLGLSLGLLLSSSWPHFLADSHLPEHGESTECWEIRSPSLSLTFDLWLPGVLHFPSQAWFMDHPRQWRHVTILSFFLYVVLSTPFYLLAQRDGEVGP